MNTRSTLIAMVMPTAVLATTLSLQAQTYDISWHTVDGGGALAMVGGPYSLDSTTGQHDAGPLLAAGNTSVLGGFWAGVTAPPTPVCPADFNHSGAVSVQDIFDFLVAYFAGDPAADFNASGVVSVQDVFDFLAAYFVGCP